MNKNRRKFQKGAGVPLIAAGIAAAVLLAVLVSVYIYKIHNFGITSISLGQAALVSPDYHAESGVSLANSSPSIVVCYSGIPGTPIKADVDGQNIELSSNWITGTSRGTVPALADGSHVLSVSSDAGSERWLVNIDTVPPEVSISHPVEGYKSNKSSITLQGTTEPGAEITASCAGKTVTGKTNEKGFFSLVLPTKMGKCNVVWTVKDSAGNVTSGKREFLCDFNPPVLDIEIDQPPCTDKDGKSWEKISVGPHDPYTVLINKSLQLSVSASDQESGIAAVEVYVDGTLRETKDYTAGGAGKDDEQSGTVSADNGGAEDAGQAADSIKTTAAAQTASADRKSVSFKYTLPGLYEGTHVVAVTARDGFNLASKRSITFCLNTTDKYGQAPLGRGAIGADVAELQSLLCSRGYLKSDYPRGKFDKKTYDAVVALQRDMYMEQDGVAGMLVVGALNTRLYVNLQRFSLVLIDKSNQAHYYSICTGVEEHPTPTGMFYISDMVKNPTWLPPNSEWAKDAKQIPPGPDNPLGTRWIGLGNSVGFHGTPYPGTVGTRASHGCMRMAIPDVEDLYERVNVGNLVRIYNGDEDDPTIKKYWP